MRTRSLIALVLYLFLSPGQLHAGFSTYIALGDSLAFGVGANDSPTDISNGDRGYVGAFADALATQQGGVRPNLFNLGISGETSSSFFQVGAGLEGLGATLCEIRITPTRYRIRR